MSAPSGTKWGDISSNNNGEGRIGLYITREDVNATTVRCYIDVWYWTKYRVSDTNNQFKVYLGDNWSSGTSVSIQTTSNSAWSESNQVFMGRWEKNITKQTYVGIVTFGASFSGVEYGGGSGDILTVYTIPTLSVHNIIYDANGGTNAPAMQTKFYGIATTLSSTVPTRKGYKFLYWQDPVGIIFYPSSSYNYNYHCTLYAVWEKITYKVTFNSNGGNQEPYDVIFEYGEEFNPDIHLPKRDYYRLLGWAKSPTATVPDYERGWVHTSPFTSDTILYAVWESTYVKPHINNLTIKRCNADMTEDEYGEYAKISFMFITNAPAEAYAVYVTNMQNGTQYTYRKTVEGYVGFVDELIKDGSKDLVLSTEYEFNIQLNVADEISHATEYRILNSAFIPVDFKENMRSVSFGEPCPEEDGLMNIAFDKVDIAPKEKLLYKGESFFGAKELWNGMTLFGNASDYITLKKKISETKNGILLVFARNSGYNLTTYFVAKETVSAYTRTTYCFPLCTGLYDYIGSKTLYISDTKIEGHSDNAKTGKNEISGITYHNEMFSLVKIYEV